MMIHLGKILVRILPWDPWLPRSNKNLARSCQDSQDASKRVNPGNKSEWEATQPADVVYNILCVILWNKKTTVSKME